MYVGVPFGALHATPDNVADGRRPQPMRRLVVTDATTGRVIDTQDRLQDATSGRVYDANASTATGTAAAARGRPRPVTRRRRRLRRHRRDVRLLRVDVRPRQLRRRGARAAQLRALRRRLRERVLGRRRDGLRRRLRRRRRDRPRAHPRGDGAHAGLEYADQSGALNESLSDMAGWDVDRRRQPRWARTCRSARSATCATRAPRAAGEGVAVRLHDLRQRRRAHQQRHRDQGVRQHGRRAGPRHRRPGPLPRADDAT